MTHVAAGIGRRARVEPQRRTRGPWLWSGLVAVFASACAAGGRSNSSSIEPDASTAMGEPDASGSGSGNGDGVGLVLGDGGMSSGQGGVVGGDGGHTQVCTDAGCTCVRIASIGHEGIWGACGMYGDGTSAFETWLDTQSTATVDAYTEAKPTLTPTFLAQYDVLILQWLRDVADAGAEGPLWQFSSDEISALAAWVQGGGGIIALSGYDGDGQEVMPLNALLSFTDFAYNMDSTYGSDCGAGCWGGACALTQWNGAGPISAHINRVGIQNGRSIRVAVDAGGAPVVDCPCPAGNACAVHEDIGKGHVFAFTDEWVTYTSQWLGTASCIAASCAGSTPADDFQVPQFWYNAIKYASAAAQCFTIQDPTILQ